MERRDLEEFYVAVHFSSIFLALHVYRSPRLVYYRIAGNFRGRKLLRNVKTGRIMDVACLEFRGENFRGWLKNREIRASFLPQEFPAIRYIHSAHNYCTLY